jgi:hypothetical protein
MDAEKDLPDTPFRIPGWYAIHGTPSGQESAKPIAEFSDGAIRVFEGDADTWRIGPVYADVEGGPPVVPTGRALVRFADDELAADRTDDIEDAGFVIAEVLSYAPQAAWVRPASGKIADAIDLLDQLMTIEGVVHAEPQFLREMETKPPNGMPGQSGAASSRDLDGITGRDRSGSVDRTRR